MLTTLAILIPAAGLGGWLIRGNDDAKEANVTLQKVVAEKADAQQRSEEAAASEVVRLAEIHAAEKSVGLERKKIEEERKGLQKDEKHRLDQKAKETLDVATKEQHHLDQRAQEEKEHQSLSEPAPNNFDRLAALEAEERARLILAEKVARADAHELANIKRGLIVLFKVRRGEDPKTYSAEDRALAFQMAKVIWV